MINGSLAHLLKIVERKNEHNIQTSPKRFDIKCSFLMQWMPLPTLKCIEVTLITNYYIMVLKSWQLTTSIECSEVYNELNYDTNDCKKRYKEAWPRSSQRPFQEGIVSTVWQFNAWRNRPISTVIYIEK